MTRKLQHLFSRATLLLLLFFVSGVTFAQFTGRIKCEIQGEGSASLYGFHDDYTTYTLPIVSGETMEIESIFVSNDESTIVISSIVGELKDILVDGVHSEEAWDKYTIGQQPYFLLKKANDFYAELTLVFEGAEEPAATQTYTVDVVGQGSVDYSYTSEGGEVKTGTFEPGVATGLDNMNMGAAYIIDITPRADEGYKFAGMKMNGEEVADALQQYEEIGMVTLETAATEVNLEVTFKEDVPEYNVVYTVTVEGEGSVDYTYYIDGSDTWEKASGTFELGVQTGLNPKMVGPTYGVDIYPKPAEGYKFVKATVNGEEKTDALSKYEKNGFFPVNSAEKEIALHLVFEKEAATPEYDMAINYTQEGEGSVSYSYFLETDGSGKGTFAAGMNEYSDMYKSSDGYYKMYLTINPAEGSVFKSVTVDGTDMTETYNNDGTLLLKSTGGQTFDVNVVFEGEAVENPYTFTVTIEGEGSVDYWYLNNDTFEKVEGVVESGVALGMNPYVEGGVYFIPKASGGYEFSAVYVNGEEYTEALEQIGMYGYFFIIPETTEVEMKVVFKSTVELPEEYDMIVNYTQEGEGAVGYFYYIVGVESAEGDLAEGLNVFPEMYKSSSVGYNLTLTPKPAQGYELKAFYVNDKKVNVSGSYRYTTKVDKETVNVKAVFGLPAATLVYEAETAEGKISVTDAEGNVLESGSECAVGANVNIVVTPATNYVLKSLKVGETELTVGEPVDGTYTVPYTMVEGENKIVAEFETTLEPDMYVNLTVEEGEGHIEYWYYLAEPLDATQEGIFSEGLNKLYNMYYSKISNYSVYVTVVPAEGYTLKSLYIGQTDYSAWYGPNEEFSLMSTSKGDTYEIKVKFEKEAEKADMIVNYTQEGNGNMSYFYYTDDADATGYMEEGSNEFWDMYLDSYGNYKMYLTATPEEGSILKSLTVDGVDKTAEYNESGNLMLTSTGGQTFDVKVVFEGEEPEPTGHKVVIRANGDVEYHVKFSNVAEQKQEFYYVSDKDTTVYLPDNAFCGWNYTYNPNFTVKNLLINGEPLLEPTFTVTSDLEISLDYVETGYYELEFEQPENGEIIVEYQVYDMEVYDYVYVPYEAGLTLQTGTGYRVTYIADEDSYIANVKVNGEEVMTSTIEDPVYEFVYEEKVWGPVSFEAEILTEISVDEVAAEPVQMTVYSVDGVLVRSCLAKDAQEAVEGLAKGLYIVNGQKVVVK